MNFDRWLVVLLLVVIIPLGSMHLEQRWHRQMQYVRMHYEQLYELAHMQHAVLQSKEPFPYTLKPARVFKKAKLQE